MEMSPPFEDSDPPTQTCSFATIAVFEDSLTLAPLAIARFPPVRPLPEVKVVVELPPVNDMLPPVPQPEDPT
jgi:hypothetical protein